MISIIPSGFWCKTIALNGVVGSSENVIQENDDDMELTPEKIHSSMLLNYIGPEIKKANPTFTAYHPERLNSKERKSLVLETYCISSDIIWNNI
ncbi:Hypothetical predicted protein [Octopus vulgaris]|uniref:Uncharacterized protein n=1 Tax=Octopus vulgaris TaxID=6645 RepID=A0AA36BJQ5_OCTVU|nr:Hypothetical predicted protein [Octopus vulgaris]